MLWCRLHSNAISIYEIEKNNLSKALFYDGIIFYNYFKRLGKKKINELPDTQLSDFKSFKTREDTTKKIFIDWINQYSELHFQVIGAIYNSNGISRGTIWKKIGKTPAREDSAEADLYKLLFRDLSTGGIVRQHREIDYYGNFLTKPTSKRRPKGSVQKTMKSAFDEEELYVLTNLGQQFVHYAMTDIPTKIEYKPHLNREKP